METRNEKGAAIEHYAPTPAEQGSLPAEEVTAAHGSPKITGTEDNGSGEPIVTTADELEASQTGRFAYVKSQDFVIVLVLGYAFSFDWIPTVSLTAHIQSSPCAVHHLYQYLLLFARRTRHLYPCLPDLLQLCLTQHRLYRFHPLPLWLQGLVSSYTQGRMEVHHLVLSRCSG